MAQAIKASFDIPSYPIVHFDTKLVMPKGKYLEERGSVLISGGDELQEPKLLGIPKFPSSKGADVAATVAQQLDEYGIDLTQLTGIIYDTTASNSGWKSGATWRLEKEIGHPVIGLECRKHVQELHISHAAKSILGETKGPTKSLYKRLSTLHSDFVGPFDKTAHRTVATSVCSDRTGAVTLLQIVPI